MTDIISRIDAMKSPVVWKEEEPFFQEPLDTSFSLEINSRTKNVSEIKALYSDLVKSRKIGLSIDSTSSIEENALFIDYLIQAENTNEIYKFCDSFDSDKLRQILNATPYNMYYGNVLHSTLYSNIGDIAKELYIYFRDRGAVPCRDYYGEFPWEQTGIIWTCIPGQNYKRDVAEFTEIYQWAQTYEDILQQIKDYEKIHEKVNIQTNNFSCSNLCYCKYHQNIDSEFEYGYTSD